MQIPIQLLSSVQSILNPVHDNDAGYDLIGVKIIKNNTKQLWFSTELAIDLPPNVMGAVFPRSSISKRSLMLANGIGLIDPGFRGEIQVRFNKIINQHPANYYEEGEAIAQLVFIPFFRPELVKVNEFEKVTSRGKGGFGSTDSQRVGG